MCSRKERVRAPVAIVAPERAPVAIREASAEGKTERPATERDVRPAAALARSGIPAARPLEMLCCSAVAQLLPWPGVDPVGKRDDKALIAMRYLMDGTAPKKPEDKK